MPNCEERRGNELYSRPMASCDQREPIWLISELDANRWEMRKVEVFPDGAKGYASRGEEVRGTSLGQLAVPPLQEIASDPQFLAEEITKEEFEAIWEDRNLKATI